MTENMGTAEDKRTDAQVLKDMQQAMQEEIINTPGGFFTPDYSVNIWAGSKKPVRVSLPAETSSSALSMTSVPTTSSGV